MNKGRRNIMNKNYSFTFKIALRLLMLREVFLEIFIDGGKYCFHRLLYKLFKIYRELYQPEFPTVHKYLMRIRSLKN